MKNRIVNEGESDNIVTIVKPEIITSGDVVNDEQA